MDLSSRLPLKSAKLRRAQRVSALLEATTLAYGLDTLRIGGRGFMAGASPDFTSVGFQGTLSLETSRAAGRVTDDRLSRRTLLSQAGLPIPPSRQFSYKQFDDAVAFAARFKPGVLIKPKSKATGSINPQPLKDLKAIEQNIREWHGVTGDHATFLVERYVPAAEYIFYVVGGEVVSVASTQNRRFRREIFRHGDSGLGEIDPDVRALVLKAFSALPRMSHGEVRIACATNPLRAERCTVLSVSPEINLLGRRQTNEFSTYLVDRIVAHASRSSRAESTSSRITAEVVLHELSNPQNVAAAAKTWLDEAGLAVDVSPADGTVSVSFSGMVGELSTFTTLAKTGAFAGASPLSVETRQKDSS